MTRHWISHVACVLAASVFLSAVGCTSPPANVVTEPKNLQPEWFVDVTASVGIDFTHDAGPINDQFFLPQIIGSGAALFDFDGDGKLDILLVQNGGPKGSKNKLFQQQHDGRFKDVSAASGLDYAGYCMGVAIGDVNNDGRPDVYISEYGGGRLLLNRGNGRFEEVGASGIDNPAWATAVSFFDYDRDGWLDLIVVNYLDIDPTKACNSANGQRDFCHPNTFPGTIARLYRNRGCDAKGNWLGYEDKTEEAGMSRLPGPGLGVLCADLNGDGWLDIFVTNDAKANHAWINQKNGTFKEDAVARGLAFNARGEAQGNMGIAFGDIDGRGLPGIFVTHLMSENHSFWRQGPRGLFQDDAAAAGLTRSKWRGTGFGTVFADFNHDGALDLAIVNGRVVRNGPPTSRFFDAYADRNQFFVNDGNGVFRDISEDNPALCEKLNVARGLALGDVNGDGALDLLVTQIGGPAKLLRNVAPNRGNWLMVRAVDPALNRDAYGAEVRVRAGSRSWQRLIQPSFSYLCSNDPRAHFGLGSADRVDVIEVIWPGGDAERFPCPGVNQLLEVQRGHGKRLTSK